MHYVKSLLIAMIALVAVSCSKPTSELPQADVAGVWLWTRSDGGIGNNIHYTPATTGKDVTLKLTENQYFFYSQGQLTSQGTYTLESRRCIHDGGQKTTINFSACPDQAIHVLNANTLELSDEAYDGIVTQYRRAEVSIK
jgi:hypothetical protein